MKISPGDSEALAGQAMEDFNKKWQSTAGEWNDAAREQFEKEYVEEMRRSIKAAQRGMRNICDLLRQAMKECS